jgi:hypothetical protein
MKNAMVVIVGLLLSGVAMAGGWESTGARPTTSGGFTSSAVFVNDVGQIIDEENAGNYDTKKEARQAGRDLAAANNENGKDPDSVKPSSR